MDLSMSRLVGQIEAEDIISEFLPMFEYLNEHEVPYCVVGGLGVMLHAYADEGEDRYRATQDADIRGFGSLCDKGLA